MNIRDNIKALCKLKGMTQKELASKIGMKENTFNIALKNQSLNIRTLEKIADAFAVTVETVTAENIERVIAGQEMHDQQESNAKVLRCPHCGEEIELYVKAL